MFDTTFTYTSSSELPASLDTADAIQTLHEFETVIRLSPDCRGCHPIPPPKNGYAKTSGATANGPDTEMQFYEVEDDIPFIPKKFWSGGVKYQADYIPVNNGCDITVHAPGGFTSTNHWRILRDTIPEDREHGDALERVMSKDMHHAESAGHVGWYVQIVSDAKCPRTFAGFVKGALKNSHAQLEHAFIDRLKKPKEEQQPKAGRPTLSRRRSTHL